MQLFLVHRNSRKTGKKTDAAQIKDLLLYLKVAAWTVQSFAVQSITSMQSCQMLRRAEPHGKETDRENTIFSHVEVGYDPNGVCLTDSDFCY